MKVFNPKYFLKHGRKKSWDNNYYYNESYKNPNDYYINQNNIKGREEYFRYMMNMYGIKQNKLNQWRREFMEDNYKY